MYQQSNGAHFQDLLHEQARKLQDVQAEKLTSSQAYKLTNVQCTRYQTDR